MPTSGVYGPEGFSLLAARLLLREIGDRALNQEMLAVLLDDVLNYGWAVRLLFVIAEDNGSPYGGGADFDEALHQFQSWAQKALLGYPLDDAPRRGDP